MTRPPLTLLVPLWVAALAPDLHAQKPPYDVFAPADPPYYRVRYEASDQPGGLAFPVNYTVWIPPEVKALRGVVVHQHGCGEGSCKSGLTGVYDLHWQALAKKHACALLSPAYEQPEKADCQRWCDPRNGSGAAFQKCLADLGARSGHPELARVPWALWGHSGGGHWAGGMVVLHPDRVAAAWLRSGVPLLTADPNRPGVKAYTLPDAALAVPLMCNLGTKEGVTVTGDRFAGVWPANQTFFAAVRGRGGLVGVAIDPLTSHECGNQRYLAIPWLDACLSARLPKAVGDPLRPMPADAAWLGPVTGGEAAPAAKYAGDPLKAAWLPTAAIAKAWAQYVTDTKVTDATPPPAPTDLRVRGNKLTWEAEADLESGLASFVIERDGKALADVPAPARNPFGRPVFQGLQYSDTPTQPLVPMQFTDATAEPGKKHTYRVIAVNTAGLRSMPSAAAGAADDVLLADFEGDTYGDWKTTGTAFGPGPAKGTLPNQMHVEGYKGKGLVNSFYKGDGSTGTLTSPEFKIERKYISFLIGGGKDAKNLALNLLVDGKVARTATGPNDRPGGSEALAPDSWDVTDLAGKAAVIQIIDNATGGWGHINVDHIVQTDRKPPGVIANAERAFRVEKRYLNLPIKNGAKKRVVTLFVDGKLAVRNDIELADGKPDWWAPMDVSAWQGKTVTLRVDKLPEDSAALKQVEPADSLKGAETLYAEPLRGQFHFSPKRGWNNDPNGMVYFNGEYHLFFQHNPYGWNWGNMHWGHAVSKDLVHWEELGDTLLPDDLGPMFSGSAVVDHANTSGFGRDGKPPLVLVYTAAGNPSVQCLAFSTDGRTFTKYAGNPVVKQVTPGNRDPKVTWHAPTKKWVMVLYVALKGRHTVHFYTSPDLKEWTLASVTEGGTVGKDGYLFECPDLFELPVDGNPGQRKWVLLGANSEYAVGTFDGTTFKPEAERLPGHRGKGFYAPQTFADIPDRDGRRIQIGWFQTPTPGMPFNQSMTIPQELKLVSTADGPRLTRTPVKELEALRAKEYKAGPTTLTPGGANPLAGVNAELIELRAEFAPAKGGVVTFTLRGATVSYDAKTEEVVVNGHRAPAPLTDGVMRLTVFVDRTGLEVFAADERTYVPMPFTPKADARGAAVTVTGGDVRATALTAYTLRSAWKPE